jgi:4-amino-4-deoxy-L-arabinose transferase-like glycosyltransferase
MTTLLTQKKDNTRLILLAILIVFAALLRFLSMQTIKTGGDEVHYFDCAWNLFHHPSTYALDHQSARWGIIFPVALFRLFLGPAPWVYFLPAFLVEIGTVWAIFRTGERLHSTKAGILAGFLFTLFPGLVDYSTQNSPEVYFPFYMVLSLVLLLKSSDGKARLLWITLAAVSFFLAYLSKVTAVYFLPGFFVWFWPQRKSLGWKPVLLFFGLLAGLFATEVVIYRLIWNEPFGIITVILRTHLDAGNMDTMTILPHFWDLLLLYSPGIFRWYWWIVTFGVFLAAVYFSRHKEVKKYGFFLVGLVSFLFFHTFGVKSLNPVVPLEPFDTRYLLVMAPFAFLYPSIALADLAQRRGWSRWITWKTAGTVSLLLLLGYSFVWDLPFLPPKWKARGFGVLHMNEQPWYNIVKITPLVRQALENHTVIVGYTPGDPVQSKKLGYAFPILFENAWGTPSQTALPLPNGEPPVAFLLSGTLEDWESAKTVLWIESDPIRAKLVSKTALNLPPVVSQTAAPLTKVKP